MAYLVLYARLLLGIVFAVSAAGRLSPARTRAFASGIARLAGIPVRSSLIAARMTIVVELAVTTLVALSATRSAALWLASAVLLVFLVVLVRALRAGVDESCHCFGASADPVAARHVTRTAALLLVATTAATACSAGAATAVPVAGVALTVVVAGVSAAVVVLLDDLAALFVDMPPVTAIRSTS